jgi:hypothetical protein
MASFLDTFFKIILLASQVLSVYAIGTFMDNIKLNRFDREKELSKAYEKDLEVFIKGNHHEDIEVFSNRYMKNMRRAHRAQRFWNGKGPTLLILILIFLQFTICIAYFSSDFVPGLR